MEKIDKRTNQKDTDAMYQEHFHKLDEREKDSDKKAREKYNFLRWVIKNLKK